MNMKATKSNLKILGITLKEIAEATNIPHSAVCLILKEEMRSKIESKGEELIKAKKIYINNGWRRSDETEKKLQ